MTPAPRSRPRAVGLLLASIALTAAASIVAAVAATSADAQSPTSAVTTTTAPVENPGSTSAGIVFFGVCAVIVVGALVLYLRNRRPRP